jgi:hypothetical protein
MLLNTYYEGTIDYNRWIAFNMDDEWMFANYFHPWSTNYDNKRWLGWGSLWDVVNDESALEQRYYVEQKQNLYIAHM